LKNTAAKLSKTWLKQRVDKPIVEESEVKDTKFSEQINTYFVERTLEFQPLLSACVLLVEDVELDHP
jgi:hypothetical protein